MLGFNVEPDKFTFASVMTGCARLGAVNHALIQTAKEVFNSADRSDVSVWNAMINGLATHGLPFDAIAVFSKMEVENILPDSITFLGILTACSHSGLVEEGRKYFNLMNRQYSIQSQIEHYGAMVDLLGRAGQLEEGYAIIEAMPMEPDVIWRALLSACRTYIKPVLEMGKRRRSKRNDEKKGVRKIRGRSWIELGGVIHRLKAGDRSHPEMEGLYKVLEGLIRRTKLEGFLPETELVLMDISEEDKEGNLNHHNGHHRDRGSGNQAFPHLVSTFGARLTSVRNLKSENGASKCLNYISKLSAALAGDLPGNGAKFDAFDNICLEGFEVMTKSMRSGEWRLFYSFIISLPFDPTKSSHYKVVCLQEPDPWLGFRDDPESVYVNQQIEIYSSQTQSWRLPGNPFIAEVNTGFKGGVFYNGAIHWLTGWGTTSPYFNVEEAKLRQLQMPPFPDDWEDLRRYHYFWES
ncbi:hypothetical protein REPUB_Repub08aG0020800 [Reevesia pubescens]